MSDSNNNNNNNKAILVTGGAGYIGSHFLVELFENTPYRAVVIDNLSNSSQESLERVKKVTGKKDEDLIFYKADILDRKAIEDVLEKHKDELIATVHFAGLKAVGESCEKPLLYYHNNITGTLLLLEALRKYNIKNFLFSSSATVYGDPHTLPITEDFPLHATNPYGKTKLFIEEILRDLVQAEPEWAVVILRYFNPIGAHKSGTMGEDPQGKPNNLAPFVAQVAVGRRPQVAVFGNDYNTVDGTGVRDYIHVCDLAAGHVAALRKVNAEEARGSFEYNLGTGNGTSVLELIEAMKKASGKEIPHQVVERRSGDIASCYTDPKKAATELQWKATRTMDEMCADLWRWQEGNPQGYNSNSNTQA